MTAQTAAERKAAERQRKAEKGLVRVEVEVPAGTEDQVRELGQRLRGEREEGGRGVR